MINVIEDVSTLTTIPKNSLLNLCDKSNKVIGHAVYEALLEHNSCVDIKIDKLGVLTLDWSDGENIFYKFIPDKLLENMLIDVLDKHTSPLTTTIEETLVKKITNAYKNLF